MTEDVYEIIVSNRDWFNGNNDEFVESKHSLVFDSMLRPGLVVMRTNIDLSNLDKCYDDLSYFVFDKENLITISDFPSTPSPLADWNGILSDITDREDKKVVNKELLDNLFNSLSNNIDFIDERIGLYYNKNTKQFNTGHYKSNDIEDIIKYAKETFFINDLDSTIFLNNLQYFISKEDINFATNSLRTLIQSEAATTQTLTQG